MGLAININCSMCGKAFSKKGKDEFYPTQDTENKPHYNIESDLRHLFKNTAWIYQEDVCGDIYCGKKCAE